MVNAKARNQIDILHIGAQLSGGGVLEYVSCVINANKEPLMPCEHAVLAPKVIPEKISKTCDLLPYIEYPSKLICLWRPFAEIIALGNIIKIVYGLSPRLIHAHTALGGFYALACRLILGTKFVYTGHSLRFALITDNQLKALAVRITESLILQAAHYAIFLTSFELSVARSIAFKPQGFHVINTRIDVPLLQCTKGGVVLACGTLDSRKNPRLFIDIARQVLEFLPEKEFVWVGAGKLEDECRGIVASLGLSEKIHFLGHQANRDYLRLLAKSFAFLLTSTSEGLPLCVIEAQLMKKPVVCSMYPGYEEVVPSKEYGIAYPIDKAAEASAAILKLHADPCQYNAIALNAYKRSTFLFSGSRTMSAEYHRLYSSAIYSRLT